MMRKLMRNRSAIGLHYRKRPVNADKTIFMKGEAKIRLLVELHDFEGWTAGAMWEDTKFAARHFNDIERLAIMGEARWERGLATFIKPFTMAAVKYSDMQDADQARQWIREKA